jgi:hypothetical protein
MQVFNLYYSVVIIVQVCHPQVFCRSNVYHLYHKLNNTETFKNKQICQYDNHKMKKAVEANPEK